MPTGSFQTRSWPLAHACVSALSASRCLASRGYGDQSKKAAAKEKAAANEEAVRQANEDADWEVGAKGKNKKAELAAEKAAAKAERKAEANAQLEEEEKSNSAPKSSKDKKAAKAGKMTRAEIAAKARVLSRSAATCHAHAPRSSPTCHL